MDNDNNSTADNNLVPITMRGILKSRIRNDKTGQKLATQQRNRRRNRLARKNRRTNLRNGHTAGKQ